MAMQLLTNSQRVSPSVSAQPFTLEQELTSFGTWTSKPIWVPPKDSAAEMAKTMLDQCSLLASQEDRWSAVVAEHRSSFTQVREIELTQASIRLPKARLFVSVTEQADFDKITDKIPNCVKTRLEEFLQGPGRRHGTRFIISSTVRRSRRPIDLYDSRGTEYDDRPDTRGCLCTVPTSSATAPCPQVPLGTGRCGFGGPSRHCESASRSSSTQSRSLSGQVGIQPSQAALRATNLHRKCRTDGCEFDEMLALTNPLDHRDVVEQYGLEHNLSKAERDRLLALTSITLPWFISIPLAIYYISQVSVTLAPPIMVCDPAFVAEMPGSNGVVLKIGHFDEVAGVTHVEI